MDTAPHVGGVIGEAAQRPRHLVGAGDRFPGALARGRHGNRPHSPPLGRRGKAGQSVVGLFRNAERQTKCYARTGG